MARVRPAAKSFGSVVWLGVRFVEVVGLKRWDSEMRRRSSRSWARRVGASSGRVAEDFAVWVVAVEAAGGAV